MALFNLIFGVKRRHYGKSQVTQQELREMSQEEMQRYFEMVNKQPSPVRDALNEYYKGGWKNGNL